MNKPTLITFANGGTIAYLYSMDGTKLRQTVTPSGGTAEKTDYANGFLYRNAVLTEFAQPEGRITSSSMEGLVLSYEYYLKDHLGNIRVVAGDVDGDGRPEVLQEDAYDPWGLRLQGYGFVSGEENRFRYNGKELITALGLGWYDYGARMYAPDLGRWNGVDALAEKFSAISPYVYCLNSPVILVDPDGRDVINGHEKEYKKAQENLNTKKANFEKLKESDPEYKKAKKELSRAYNYLSRVENDYNMVQDCIETLKKVDPELYEKANNATFEHPTKGTQKADVIVYYNSGASDHVPTGLEGAGRDPVATTNYGTEADWKNGKPLYMPKQVYYKDTKVPLRDYGFTVILYGESSSASLANEFGDVLFAQARNYQPYTEEEKKVPYDSKPQTIYSRGVEGAYSQKYKEYIKNCGDCIKNFSRMILK